MIKIMHLDLIPDIKDLKFVQDLYQGVLDVFFGSRTSILSVSMF